MTTHKHILYHTARWTAALSAAVVVAACSADSTPQAVVPGTTDADGRIPIVVNAAVGGAATRSLSANDPSVVGNTDAFITEQGLNKVFTSGQKVDLFIYEDGGGTDYTGQLQYLKTGDPAGDLAAGHGTFTFYSDADCTSAVKRYWPSSGKALNFYAYYPAGFMAEAGVTSVTSSSAETSAITIPYDQGNANVSKAHDLLFGAPDYRPINSTATPNPVPYPKNSTDGTSAVNLNFKHCLSKIVIRIKGDGATLLDGDEDNGHDLDGTDRFNTATITLGPDLQHQYTLKPATGEATGVAPPTGETGTYNVKNSGVEAATDNYQSYYIIVPPGQTLDGKTITLKLGPDKHLTPGPTETFTIPKIGGATYSTEAGKVYTYSLVVSLHMIMSVTATIKDWETVTTPNDIPTVIE